MRVNRRKLIRELEVLYRSSYRRFLRVAVAIVGDESLGHDAVQEAFARAIRSADSFRAEGTVEGWLWSVLVNAARAACGPRLTPLGELTAEVGLEDEDAQGVTEIRKWVSSLPERQRLTVFLRYYADLDYRGIAAALDVEVGTV